MSPEPTGRLTLVATPIGNLGDLSPRAVEALRSADAVVCEDTRRTGRLLVHAGASPPRLIVANEHTEWAVRREVVGLLDHGATVCVVTDAGTPGISDPGEALVRAALDAGHVVSVVPGPVAAVGALVVSGLPTSRWVMEGFLPRSGPERRHRLDAVAAERERTVVLYEAPHRLARTLGELATRLGPDHPTVLARELTKLHEEIWRGTLSAATSYVSTRQPRGEYVIVLGPVPSRETANVDTLETRLRELMALGASRRDAVDRVAQESSVSRNTVYDLALQIED